MCLTGILRNGTRENFFTFSPSTISRARTKFTKGGHIIVWFGLTWSLEFYQQANARLDRQGQTQPVIIHHLVTKGTIDEQVIKALQAKEQGQSALMAAVKAKIEEYRGDKLG